jgi:uncharacterized GH25 family protein
MIQKSKPVCLIKGLFTLLAFLTLTTPAVAHEFWLQPDLFNAPVAAPRVLNLYVGQFFEGDLIPFSRQYVKSIHDYFAGGKLDLTPLVPAVSESGFGYAPQRLGTHVIAVDTHPNHVTLSADQVKYYLLDEGLNQIIAMRERAGQTAMPSRERYRRHIKTIIGVGDGSDNTALTRTNQRLEIVPARDPRISDKKAPLAFTLLFDNKPLAGALLKAWHRQSGQTMLIRSRSDGSGTAQVTLPFSGTWMLSVVHMIPSEDTSEFDWESFWGNLTFELN